MSAKFKGFTLVEVIITIVIMAILIGVIFEVFVTIGRISVFVQLNRGTHAEMIYAIQTIQNMVDDQTMQLTGLDLSSTGGDSLTHGWKKTLQLADDKFYYEINSNCEDASNCFLELRRSPLVFNTELPEFNVTGSVALTDPDITDVGSFMVRTLPYASPVDYEQIMHEGFWLLFDLRVPQYKADTWFYNVQQQTQLFFTMRKYE